MSNTARAGAGRNAPLFAWLGPLAGIAELGTSGYPRPARRQMAIVNLMAALIAIFSAVYALVFALYGADTYLQLIVANLLLVAVALLVPLAHRVNDIAGALLIAIAEFAALFYFVRVLGHDSGIQINYIVAAAVAFAICGMTRFRLTVGVIVAGLGLHLAAWFLYPPERAMIAAPPALLANLYVSSAVTTFGMIALIVGYAFTLADRARAEADSLLSNILPDAVAERLKERPGERVAECCRGRVTIGGIGGCRPRDHMGEPHGDVHTERERRVPGRRGRQRQVWRRAIGQPASRRMKERHP